MSLTLRPQPVPPVHGGPSQYAAVLIHHASTPSFRLISTQMMADGPATAMPLPPSPPDSRVGSNEDVPEAVRADVEKDSQDTPTPSQALPMTPEPSLPSTGSGLDETEDAGKVKDQSARAAERLSRPASEVIDGSSKAVPTASAAASGSAKRRTPQLADFELVRVIGKGCAGRVSGHSSAQESHLSGNRSSWSAMPQIRPYTPSRRSRSAASWRQTSWSTP